MTASELPPHDLLPSEKDRLFLNEEAPQEFRFDEAVARVFPDMLRRSIPGYSALLHMIGVLARDTVQANTHVYDLGCSLGAVSLSIRHAIGTRPVSLVAIDNSPAMVEKCRELVSADSALCPVEVREGDISRLELAPCSLVVLNFTLQFAEQEQRARIVQEIANQLVPGGALVISEKTNDNHEPRQRFYAETHDSFRESNGYSRLEMSRKREALERVLIPETAEQQVSRLESAGLEVIEWFRCLNFVSWVAFKR